jgi:tripartite-type tricarboxylate transporter receptor subunit TctC
MIKLARQMGLRSFGLLVAAFMAGNAAAQDFPSRPITIVVPFAPGGAGDILGRMVGAKMEQRWGKTVLIENKTGAGGVIGANAVAKASPDGYTLMIAPSSTMAVNVTLFKNLSYDPLADFIPIALAAQTPFVLVVNPELPVRSLSEFIAYAKAKDGQLSYATAGPGVPHHLFAELLKSLTGIRMSPVAYRGSLPALNDVVAGHVPVMFVDLGPGLGIVQAGKVRPIGVSTRQRVAAIAAVPPIAEMGLPDFDAASWQMIVAPAKTPAAVVDRLHDALAEILALPEIRSQIAGAGMLPVDRRSVRELQDYVKSEIVRWGKVVQQAGIAGSE